jgi:hypothetical protein
MTSPELYYSDKMLLDRDGRVITNQTVNARRSVMEMEWLANRHAIPGPSNGHEPRPMMPSTMVRCSGSSAQMKSRIAEVENDYMEALQRLYDSGAILVGYADRPRSTNLISLLHLMNLAPEQVNDANLKTNGDLEGLPDAALFSVVLEPGERSAIMVQNSPKTANTKSARSGVRDCILLRQRLIHKSPDYRAPRNADVGGVSPTGGRCAARAGGESMCHSGTQTLPLRPHPRRRNGLRKQPGKAATRRTDPDRDAQESHRAGAVQQTANQGAGAHAEPPPAPFEGILMTTKPLLHDTQPEAQYEDEA